MAKYDLFIRGGEVVDGLGGPRRRADVGVRDGRIAAVEAELSGDAAETVDAMGLLVTPGFVDIHTHYNGQVSWDSAPRTSEAAKPTSDAMEQGYDGRLDMVDEGATKPSSPALRVDEPPREPPERAGTHGAQHTPVLERTPGTQLDADGMIQTAKSSSS